MNRIKTYKLGLIPFFALFLFSCDKETEGLSRSTYYVAFEILGDNPAIAQVGEPYVDAGVVATEQGTVVTSTATSNVNYEAMGMYQVEYTAVNVDGLKSRAIRDVIICNPDVTTDISGTWHAAEGTYRWYAPGTITPYSGSTLVTNIVKVAPGFFSVSDFFAGYYAVRAGYGPNYAMTGYIALNEDNTINLVSSYVGGWRDGLNFLDNAVYDSVAGTIKWEAGYAKTSAGTNQMTFFVTLTK